MAQNKDQKTEAAFAHPHPVDVAVGARVREIRLRRNITQSELGQALGVSFQQIQKYEQGTNRISASKIYDAAEALGVGLADIFPEPGRPVVPRAELDKRVPDAFTIEVGDLAHQVRSDRRRMVLEFLRLAVSDDD